MWIQNSNDATTRLFNADLMDEPVEFSENGTAQVPADIGEALIAQYDSISEHDTNED